jgi:hypothetical protein
VIIVFVVLGTRIAADGVRVFAQQGAISIDAPAWRLGDQWTWQRGKDQVSSTLVGTTGDYTFRVQIGSDTSMSHYSLDFSSRDAHFTQFQFPLTAGKEWSYVIDGTFNGRAFTWVVHRKVEAIESTTVPAGTFDAVRISGHHCNVTVGGCGDFVVWYAPQVRQAAKITWDTSYWPPSLRGLTQVLVSYQLSNP